MIAPLVSKQSFKAVKEWEKRVTSIVIPVWDRTHN